MGEQPKEKKKVKVKVEDLDPKDVFEYLGKPAAHRGIGTIWSAHRQQNALERELKSVRCGDRDAVAAALERLGAAPKPAKRTARSTAERAAEKRDAE